MLRWLIWIDYGLVAMGAAAACVVAVAALTEIATGVTDEGGNRRNHPNATSIARVVLGMTK